MRMTKVYEVFTDYRKAEQEGRITKNELELLIEFILESCDYLPREQFVENYNRWYNKTHGEKNV